jgi:hypothetical protein
VIGENIRTVICIFEAMHTKTTMKTIYYVFFLLLLLDCKDKAKPADEQPPGPGEFLRSYVKNPRMDDRMCKMIFGRQKKIWSNIKIFMYPLHALAAGTFLIKKKYWNIRTNKRLKS